jgi:hypothetical protein
MISNTESTFAARGKSHFTVSLPGRSHLTAFNYFFLASLFTLQA